MIPTKKQTARFHDTLDRIVEAVLKGEDIRPLVALARQQINELGLFVEPKEEPNADP